MNKINRRFRSGGIIGVITTSIWFTLLIFIVGLPLGFISFIKSDASNQPINNLRQTVIKKVDQELDTLSNSNIINNVVDQVNKMIDDQKAQMIDLQTLMDSMNTITPTFSYLNLNMDKLFDVQTDLKFNVWHNLTGEEKLQFEIRNTSEDWEIEAETLMTHLNFNFSFNSEEIKNTFRNAIESIKTEIDKAIPDGAKIRQTIIDAVDSVFNPIFGKDGTQVVIWLLSAFLLINALALFTVSWSVVRRNRFITLSFFVFGIFSLNLFNLISILIMGFSKPFKKSQKKIDDSVTVKTEE